jgi:hypothetical protein
MKLDWSIVVPLLTAIAAGLIAFVSNAYVGYINNRGTTEVEHQKFVADIELERQKFRSNLIIEAVKTGDKAKQLII